MSIDIEKDDIQTALKKLKARENTYKKLEEISGLGSWEVDFTNNTAQWSDRSFEIYGYKPGEFIPDSTTFFKHALPEYVQKAQKLIDEMIQTKEVRTFHAKIRRKDGKIIDVILSGQIIEDNGAIKLIGTTQDITEYISLQREAKELLEILEKSTYEIYIIDEEFRYMYVNEGACKKLGYTKEEFSKMSILDINPYLTHQHAVKIKERMLQGEDGILNKTIHRTKDGVEYPVQSYLQIITFRGRKAVLIFDTDISEIVELENKQQEQAKILETINIGVVSTDLEGNVFYQNSAADKILYHKNIQKITEIFEKTYKELLDDFDNIDISDYEKIEVEVEIDPHTTIFCELSLTFLKNVYNELYGIVWLFQDITEEKYKEHLLHEQALRLQYQANHDALTGLPNRVLFQDRLQQAVFYAKRYKKKFALFFIDLDKFKQLNDSYGHYFGDLVLLEMAKRLKEAIREEDTLARLGGDEFTVIAKHIETKEDAASIAKKMIRSLEAVMKINDYEIYTSISIGISIYPDDSEDETNLIKFADSAMYKAKEEGRNQYRFYSPELTSSLFEKIKIENNLRQAILDEAFDVYFQPQIDIKKRSITCVEALVRWIDPELGVVMPGKFIHVAQESGLITKIDRIVMKKAMQQFSLWKKRGFEIGKLSLNLAMKQLLEKDFFDIVQENIKKFDFQPEWLEFEVTEGDVMQNPAKSIEILKRLHDLGVAISVDDFGTGYSSLAYLTKLPLDKLKIDRSFVIDVASNSQSKEVVTAVVVLAKSLHLDIVAEGVETQEQLSFLHDKGCDTIQGYYFAKPLSIKEFEEFVAKTISFKFRSA